MGVKMKWPGAATATLALWLWASVMLLSGCGGAGVSQESVPAPTPNSKPADPGASANSNGTGGSAGSGSSERLSLLAYAAKRQSAPAANAGAGASESELRMLQTASLSLAVAQLQARASAGTWLGNVQVSPALSASLEQLLRAAAAGATLAQVPALLPNLSTARQTAASRWVQRDVWAPPAQTFTASFLLGSDLQSGALGSTQWRAAQADFAAGSSLEFKRVLQELLPPMLPQSEDFLSTFLPAAQTRLLVLDSLRTRMSWPEMPELVSGRFVNEKGAPGRVEMLRLRQGVQRFQGKDFSADLLQQEEFVLVYLRPTASSLQGFLSSSLQPAFQQVLNAADAKTLLPGELLLPLVQTSLSSDVAAPLLRGGLRLAQDELHADLSGLDGGGAFARFQSPAATLQISATGVDVRSAHVLSLIGRSPGGLGPSPASGSAWREPLLLPLAGACNAAWSSSAGFLLLLDRQRMVLSLNVLADAGATPCAS